MANLSIGQEGAFTLFQLPRCVNHRFGSQPSSKVTPYANGGFLRILNKGCGVSGLGTRKLRTPEHPKTQDARVNFTHLFVHPESLGVLVKR
jgi:hypothetical protein